MPKLMIETNTIKDKAQVKKFLHANKIMYVKNDIGNESYIFYFDHDSNNVDIPNATYSLSIVKSTVTPEDADKESVNMKQPEVDNIEPKEEKSYNYTNLKLLSLIGGLFGLLILYIVFKG